MNTETIGFRERVVVTLLLAAARVIYGREFDKLDVWFWNALKNKE